MAGSKNPDIKCRVSLDRNGLPRIIPLNLRLILADNENQFEEIRGVIGGVLTFLSMYRIIGWFPKVDLKSILDPFNGTTRSFEPQLLAGALGDLLKSSRTAQKKWTITSLNAVFRGHKVKLHLSESAGPNGGPSTLGLWYDAFAFLHNPKKLLAVIAFYFTFSGW